VLRENNHGNSATNDLYPRKGIGSPVKGNVEKERKVLGQPEKKGSFSTGALCVGGLPCWKVANGRKSAYTPEERSGPKETVKGKGGDRIAWIRCKKFCLLWTQQFDLRSSTQQKTKYGSGESFIFLRGGVFQKKGRRGKGN